MKWREQGQTRTYEEQLKPMRTNWNSHQPLTDFKDWGGGVLQEKVVCSITELNPHLAPESEKMQKEILWELEEVWPMCIAPKFREAEGGGLAVAGGSDTAPHRRLEPGEKRQHA